MSNPINRSDPGDMPRYKVTNAGAEEWIKNRARLLCSMWEDGRLEEWESAEELARWIEEMAPGMFVLVNTDDNVTPSDCGTEYPGQANAHGDHWNCWYYYPDYRLFLMARTAWEAVVTQCMAMWDAHQGEHQCRVQTTGEVTPTGRQSGVPLTSGDGPTPSASGIGVRAVESPQDQKGET